MKLKILQATTYLLCSILITSCSTKFAYNYLDWALEWYAGKYVSLDDEQQWLLNSTIEKSLKWHRKTQLPTYVNSLDLLIDDIKGEITLSKLKVVYETNEKYWNTVKQHSAPLIAELLLNLTDDQVNEMFENLEEQNQELEQEYVSKPREALIEQRAERMIDRLEDWIDYLDKKQKKIVLEWSQQYYPLSDRWIMNRRVWQKAFEETFKHRKKDPEYFRERVTDLLQNSRQFWNLKHRRLFQSNIELTLSMLAEIHSTLDKDQRDYLLEEIRSLRNQFEELSKEA